MRAAWYARQGAPDDAKAHVAREAGADDTINYRSEDVVDAIKRLTDGAVMGNTVLLLN